MTLASEIYADVSARLVMVEDEVSEDTLALVAVYAFTAADIFIKYEGMSHEERKRYALGCSERITAAF